MITGREVQNARRIESVASRVAADQLSEKQLQSTVEQIATAYGWRWYHTYRSDRSPRGFPDLVMVHPSQRRVLWVELKSATGRLSKDQKAWLADLETAGEEAYVWRPADLHAGTITATLQPR